MAELHKWLVELFSDPDRLVSFLLGAGLVLFFAVSFSWRLIKWSRDRLDKHERERRAEVDRLERERRATVEKLDRERRAEVDKLERELRRLKGERDDTKKRLAEIEPIYNRLVRA